MMTDPWERCVICGEEWPAGTRAECPYYRDAAHRQQRMNNHAWDVFCYDRAEPAPVLAVAPVLPGSSTGAQTAHFDPARLAIAISTHDQPRLLELTLRSALASVPTWRHVFIIGNHPHDAQTCAALAALVPSIEFLATGRTPEDHGNLAKSWNQALQWAFRDPEVDWLWCMHDDMRILPGWTQTVEIFPADFYAAPFGDMCFLLNRQAFRSIGWFDERFTTRHFQDTDYLMRAAWKLGLDRVVLENDCVSLRWVTVNAVGLSQHWRSMRQFDNSSARQKTLSFGREWLTTKWANAFGTPPVGEVRWPIAIAEGPAVPDLDWYPWFER